MAVDATKGSGNGPTVKDMESQADANFQRQLALNMASERITAQSNAEKTRHDAMMAVISNFKG